MRNLLDRSNLVKVANNNKKSVRLTAIQRRTQLLEIGRQVFAERGFGATSVEEIALRAGVSKPILYDHFGGKEDLFAAVVEEELHYIQDSITNAVMTGTPRARLEQATLAYLNYVHDRPLGFAVLLRDAPQQHPGGELPALMYDVAGRICDVFAEQFSEAGYDPQSAPVYAHALVGMVAFVGQWWTESDEAPPVDVVASHIAALAWRGLRHLPRQPTLIE